MTYHRADLRAGPLHERHHRRDQGADRLHGGLPDDDGQGHLHHQRHRARRRVAARPFARASSSSPAATPRPSSPAPSTPTAVSGSSSTSRPSPARTSPPAPASPASAASRLFVLLRALGFEDEAFLERFVRHFDFLEGQWEKERDLAPTREEALVEIYKRARPGEPPSVESAKAYFENAFFNNKRYDLTRVGRYKLNRKLGPEIEKISEILDIDLERPDPNQGVLANSEMLAAATYMLHLANGEPGYRLDDQDHFANRRIRSVGELIQNQVRVGLSRMERVVRERMTTQDVEAITPQTLINIRPVVAAIKEFFGTSQLSPVHGPGQPAGVGLTHKRRLSALGPGGLSRERAGFEVRDVHTSHYGRMCPIETPEGPNIGLIGALATYGRVNEYGFIETPYRKVVERPGHRRDHLPRGRRGGRARHRPGQRRPRRQGQVHRGARARAPRPAGRRRARRRRRHLLRHHVGDRLRAARARSTSWTSRRSRSSRSPPR